MEIFDNLPVLISNLSRVVVAVRPFSVDWSNLRQHAKLIKHIMVPINYIIYYESLGRM